MIIDDKGMGYHDIGEISLLMMWLIWYLFVPRKKSKFSNCKVSFFRETKAWSDYKHNSRLFLEFLIL